MMGARAHSPPGEVQEQRPMSRYTSTRENLRWARVTDLTTISETDEDQFLDSGSSNLGMGSDPSIHATDNRTHISSTGITPVFHFVPPMDLTGKITRDGKYPIHGGGFADVYAGFLSLETANIQKVMSVLCSNLVNSPGFRSLLKSFVRTRTTKQINGK
jgi:hypothetical protein